MYTPDANEVSRRAAQHEALMLTTPGVPDPAVRPIGRLIAVLGHNEEGDEDTDTFEDVSVERFSDFIICARSEDNTRRSYINMTRYNYVEFLENPDAGE